MTDDLIKKVIVFPLSSLNKIKKVIVIVLRVLALIKCFSVFDVDGTLDLS